MFTRLIDLFKHAPATGDGKDHTMPDAPAPIPASSPTSKAATPPPPPPADVQRQLAQLADAMRELSQSQKGLLDVVTRAAGSGDAYAQRPASPDVSGDPGEGLRPAAMVDYSRLTPLQQITLGLRQARPLGPSILRTRVRNVAPDDVEVDAENGAHSSAD